MTDGASPASRAAAAALEAALGVAGDEHDLPPEVSGYDDGGGQGDEPPPPGNDGVFSPPPVLAACALEPPTDIGNSRRFRMRYGDLAPVDQRAVLHVQNIGWFVWDSRRWKEDGDDRGLRPLAHRTAELIAHEARLILPTPAENEALNEAVAVGDELEQLEATIEALSHPKEGQERDAEALARQKKRRMTLQRIVDHAERIEKAIQKRRTDRRRHGNSTGNSGKLDGMLNEARPYISCERQHFDRDKLAINLDNGTLVFRKAEIEDLDCPDPDVTRFKAVWQHGMHGHDRTDFNAKLAPVFWCPEAKAPLFKAFLERVMPNPAIRAYLQRFFGYCLTGLTSEQVFAVFHGEGANGKSTLVDVIGRILDDYSTTVPVASLMAENARKAQDATPDLNRLPGARFVRTSEPKEGLALDEALVKELTGGEPINLRRLNQESIQVYPEFKLVISCNRKPRIIGNDDGIWRRIALVPFEVQIPKEERDKGLVEKLWLERSGILNWMVEGCLDYLERGQLAPPGEILVATQEWRDDSDVIGAFVRAALEITRNPSDTIETGPLYESYLIYAKRTGITPIAGTTFNRRLPKTAGDFGFNKGKSSISLYEGVRFRVGFDPSHTRFDHHRG